MYVRNLRKPSANKNVYKFVSAKNGCTIMCESLLEYDCCYYLEYSDDVVSFCSQPMGYQYRFNGVLHSYTPDFFVEYRDGSTALIEVKPLKMAFEPGFREMFQCMQAEALNLKTQLILVTDRQICSGLYLENLKLLHRYSGCIENSRLAENVLRLLNQSIFVSVGQVSQALNISVGLALATIFRLISLGRAKTKLDIKIDEHSIISVA
ncbi:TPA: TnsA endonuclease N-terminal domain-containing protein [Vibrio parahaemolyticus]